MIQPGKYKGEIVGYGMRKTKAGDLSPTIKFQVNDDGKAQFVFWQKNFATAKLVDQVLKELVTCGLKDPSDFEYIAEGPDSNVLDMDKEISIVVEHENYDGRAVPKVIWINADGDSQGSGDKWNITREETARLLETVDISGAFERAFKAVHKSVDEGTGHSPY